MGVCRKEEAVEVNQDYGSERKKSNNMKKPGKIEFSRHGRMGR